MQQKMKQNKKGLSTIVTTLIIVLLVLVAVGIIWVVVRNILNKNSEEISLDKFTVTLKVDSQNVKVNPDGSLSLKIKRTSGAGNLVGVGFVISNGTAEYYEKFSTSLKEQEETWFTINPNGNIKFGTNSSIIVVPIIESKGKEVSGNNGILYSSTTNSTKSYNTGKISPRSGGTIDSPECTPSCSGKQCGSDSCGGSCGSCSSGFNCNSSGQCVSGTSCVDSDGDSYNISATRCGTLFDCNDTNINVNPGATEICNGIDNNCVNGISDETCAGGYVVERLLGSHATFPLYAGPKPNKCESFIDPNSGMKVTRITNIRDIVGGIYVGSNKNVNAAVPSVFGNPASGHFNGYARYSDVNVNGKYLIAFRTNAHSSLYRISDCAYLGPIVPNANDALGESNELRWDKSGVPGTETRIYYIDWSGNFCQQDALLGYTSAQCFIKFRNIYTGCSWESTGDMDMDESARYFSFKMQCTLNSNETTFVYDRIENKTYPEGMITQNTVGVDMSPDGKWLVMVTDHDDIIKSFRFYSVDKLKINDTSNPVYLPSTIDYKGNKSVGHNGWGIYNGQYVLTYQDNKDDEFKAFNPNTGEQISFGDYLDYGADWCLNQHIARSVNTDKSSWALMSTYTKPIGSVCNNGGGNIGWGGNQLMMLELKPKTENPKIWRLGGTQTTRFNSAGIDIGGYFAEAFASIDMEGNNIYWGSNWYGTDNLEVYRMELPTTWNTEINAI